MVIDRLENLERYVSLHPLFPQISHFIKEHDLLSLTPGRVILQEDKLWVNVDQAAPKKRQEALLEAHRKFIDIQIPLTATEEMGYTPLAHCTAEAVPYDEERDIVFFSSPVETYLSVSPGMFTIFFPEDGHAPAITEQGVRKLIFKISL